MTAETKALPASTGSNDDESEMTPLSRQLKLTLLVLCITNFLDTIGYMALFPSLIFYVRQLGGTDDQYGLILSVAAITGFCFVPLYGSWVDANGKKFRKPFFMGYVLSISGMLLYTLAAVFGKTSLAFYVLLASRIIYGAGASSASISTTYIALVTEPDQLIFCQLLFTVASNMGLACAPLANMILGGLDVTVNVFGLTIPLNAYNGVGVLLAAFDCVAFVLMYLFLPEPKNSDEDAAAAAKAIQDDEPKQENGGWKAVFREIASSIKLLLPIFALFVIMANYNLIETTFSPAASHGLGWGPVQISAVYSISSIGMFSCTIITMVLSKSYKIRDTTFILVGFTFWTIAGLMMYSLWTYPGKEWHFVASIAIALIGFPLIGPAATSLFAKAIMTRPDLEPLQARLFAVLNMAPGLAGFIAPLYVGVFVLRSPELVESGTNDHELTPFALYVPFFSGLCIIGFLYEKVFLHADDCGDDNEEGTDGDGASELTTLLKAEPKNRRSSIASTRSILSAKNHSNLLRSSWNHSIRGGSHSMQPMPFDANEKKRLENLLKEDLDELSKEARDMEKADTPTETQAPGNNKLFVLISSFSSNHQQKSHQDRALTILKGLQIGPDQMETIDGAAPANKEKRNELFVLSGIRAKYPQFFLVDASDKTTFLTDWEGFELMHEMGTLSESMNLA